MMLGRKAVHGFTLLEVLVAVSIFAIVGLGANKLLRTVIDTQARVSDSNDALSDLTRAFSVLEKDLGQVVPRSVRDEYGERLPPMMVGTGTYVVEFTRTGWNNPTQSPRSDMQRVAYHLDGEVLYRSFWLVLDRAEDSVARSQVLLRNVADFRVNVMDREGNTTDLWPDSESTIELPPSIEVIVETRITGEMRRYYAMTEPRALDGNDGGVPGQPAQPGQTDADVDVGGSRAR